MEEETAEIEARIAELRRRYARLKNICSFGARVSPETSKQYADEIAELQTQLN